MKLVGERITIRDFVCNDENDLYEFSHDEEVAYSAGWKPHTSIDITRRVLVSYVISKECYAIVLNSMKKVIGSIEIDKSHIRIGINAFELGFCLNKNYWGNGYAQEASKLILGYAFKNANADVIEICHLVNNERSEHTILNLGFKRIGVLRKYKKMYNGKIEDVVLYEMTKEDYERMNK